MRHYYKVRKLPYEELDVVQHSLFVAARVSTKEGCLIRYLELGESVSL